MYNYICNIVTQRTLLNVSEFKCFHVSCIRVSVINVKLPHRESIFMCQNTNVSMFLVSMFLVSMLSCHTEDPFSCVRTQMFLCFLYPCI